jgi:hypothetical protein
MSAASEVDDLIESLGELTPAGRVYAQVARALAADVDDPPMNNKGVRSSVATAANALRATIAALTEVGCVDDSDEDKADDWASAAAGAGATPIRNTS